MPHIARSETNTPSMLALHAVDSLFHLYDPETVEFRIVDASGTQVFPAMGWEDVTTDGRVDTGVYYAYDTGASAGWTPADDEDLGEHRIYWRFTDEDGSTVRTWSLAFDVSEEGTGLGYWSYLSPQRVRSEGVSDSEVPAAWLKELIATAQQLLERECRQPFRPIRHTFDWDGAGGSTWFLPVPVIGLEHLKTNHSTTALAHDDYVVNAYPSLGTDPGWTPGDARRNPKIKLCGEFSASTFRPGGIYGPRSSSTKFYPGAKPHQAKGVWGYLEADGTTPLLIQKAMLQLVMMGAVRMSPGTPPLIVGGPAQREKTDAHEIEYGRSSAYANLSNALAATIEVQEIIRAYRAPLGIASPATTWSREFP